MVSIMEVLTMKIKKVNAPKSDLVVKGQSENCIYDCVRYTGYNTPGKCTTVIDAYKSVDN